MSTTDRPYDFQPIEIDRLAALQAEITSLREEAKRYRLQAKHYRAALRSALYAKPEDAEQVHGTAALPGPAPRVVFPPRTPGEDAEPEPIAADPSAPL